jgi:hypothetical protein
LGKHFDLLLPIVVQFADQCVQRWLFALEGMLTGLIGIVSYFYLPPSPTQTASRFRGEDGWFNEHEEKISTLFLMLTTF